MPGFLCFCLKRPEVNIHLHSEFTLEIVRCSPRVPAGAASAIFEFAGGENLAGLIDDLEVRLRLQLPVFLSSGDV